MILYVPLVSFVTLFSLAFFIGIDLLQKMRNIKIYLLYSLTEIVGWPIFRVIALLIWHLFAPSESVLNYIFKVVTVYFNIQSVESFSELFCKIVMEFLKLGRNCNLIRL